MKLESRIQRLEKSIRPNRDLSPEELEVEKEARKDLTDDDLERIRKFFERGVSFYECTPEEIAALDRCSDAYDAAALKVTGRPLSDLGSNRDSRPARRNRHSVR
jgi:hypothetical protein